MNKLVLAILFFFPFVLYSHDNDNPDSSSPTRSIMRLLARSKTERGGDLLVELVDKQNNFSPIKTIALGGIKAHFEISKEDDVIKIKSYIEDTQVKEFNPEEISDLRDAIKDSYEKMGSSADSYSNCNYVAVVDFDKTTHVLRVIFKCTCQSIMPFALFLQKLGKIN